MMNKTTKTTTLLLVFFCCFSLVYGQVTQTTIQPSNKDAHIINTSPSYTYNNSQISCYVNRNSSTTYIRRGFIDFDLSNIPTNAIIIDAKLKLYRVGGLSSPTIEVARIIEDWEESGTNDVNWSNQPDVSLSDEVVTTPSVSSGFHIFDITDQVQNYVNFPNLNFGWRLKSNSESPGSYPCLDRYGNPSTCYYTLGTTYGSSSYGTVFRRPILEVDWVLPIEIELQSITHATSTTNSNGSITADVSEGDGNYTYEWIDGSTGNVISGQTTSTVTGLSYGWYGLHVTDGEGVEAYKAFLVGANCETVTIDFEPGADYIDDAMVYDLVYNGTDYGQTYNGGSSTVVPRTERWTVGGNWYTCRSLVRFNIDIAQDLDIQTSDLYLYGTGNHWNHTGTNESEINRITSDWEELLVTYDEAPGITSVDQILLPQTTSSGQNETIDAIDFFQYWQTNPTNNFGFMFDLQNMTSNTYRRRRYYSSDASSSRPKIEFEVSIDCLSKVYVELQRKLDGGHYNAVDDEVSFIHREEYSDTDGLLDFRVLDYQGSEVLNSSNQSVAIQPGYNEVDIDVSSLSAGTYVLEVMNEKEETLKLRFKI